LINDLIFNVFVERLFVFGPQFGPEYATYYLLYRVTFFGGRGYWWAEYHRQPGAHATSLYGFIGGRRIISRLISRTAIKSSQVVVFFSKSAQDMSWSETTKQQPTSGKFT
jgi:hypothetical protein